jgi:hypothetical protein
MLGIPCGSRGRDLSIGATLIVGGEAVSGADLITERSGSQAEARPIAVAAVLASAIVFLLNTRHGIGVLPDSVGYMRMGPAGARFGPVYTWLLEAFSTLGGGVVGAARALGFILVCVNSLLTWLLLIKATGSLPATALGAALILSSPVFVHLHSSAMSEPLFLTLTLLFFFAFVQLLETQSRVWVALAGLLAGAAMLTRFAAAPLVPTFILCRLLLPGQPLRRRAVDCAIMAAIALAAFAAWGLYSQLSTGHSTGRALAFYGNPDARRWLTGAIALASMLAPAELPRLLHFAFLLAALTATSYAAASYLRGCITRPAKRAADGYAAVPLLCAAFILFYALLLILAVHVEANLPLNTRYLLPVYVVAVLMASICAAQRRGAARFTPAFRMALAAIAGCVLISNLTRTAMRTADAYAHGIGYADPRWSSSPMLQWVDALPEGATIYTNAPDLVSYRLQRPARFVPSRITRQTGEDDPANPLRRQVEEAASALAARDSYVVFFDRVDWRFYLASEAQLVRELGLALAVERADGRAYRRAAAR